MAYVDFPSIYQQFPGEDAARAIARMERIIAGFNAREAEGKWSEGRERNRATAIRTLTQLREGA